MTPATVGDSALLPYRHPWAAHPKRARWKVTNSSTSKFTRKFPASPAEVSRTQDDKTHESARVHRSRAWEVRLDPQHSARNTPWTPAVARWISPGRETENAFPRSLNGDISPSPEVISHLQFPPAPTFCYNLGNALGSSFFFFPAQLFFFFFWLHSSASWDLSSPTSD